MLKKLLIPLFMLLASATYAQLNNQWIDYSKTYYKFRLAKDTLCRISQGTLATVGLGSVPAEQFQLWRNGEQVRLYTSVSAGPLGGSGYIEFWGLMNDGKPDNQLFRQSDFQLADRYSLENDTSSYYLTVNPAGGNLRFTDAANPNPGSMTSDPYFMRSIDYAYRNQINRGEARIISEYIYSSSYDPAEGWASNTIAPCCDLTQQINNLNVYTAGPTNGLSVRVNAAGTANNVRNLRIKLFSNDITQTPYGSPIDLSLFTYKKVNLTGLPISLLQSTSLLLVNIGNTSTNSNDRLVVASLGVTYPATFNFNSQKYFSFSLAPSASGNYLQIDNFNYGSTAPVLYDLNTGARYTGDISSAPQVRFVLPPSSDPERKFILVNEEGSMPINSLSQKNFTDFSAPANQGNYIIISNPVLYNDGSGNNYVDQYRQYRSSVAGGGYNAKIYDINELTEQFGFGIKNHPGAIRDFIRYTNNHFDPHPQYVFIIGRGMDYISQKQNEANPLAAQLDLVPTFGWPASDVLLASLPGTSLPLVPIGRLGAINGSEVSSYLQKIIEYEQVQQSSSSSIADRAWMKKIMHIVGGKDSAENAMFKYYMEGYEEIAEDTLWGGNVETFLKNSTGTVQQASSDRIEQLINGGLGFIGYFGHSSANTFEFNLSNPDIYTNAGKYPFFNVSGCSAGNFFIFDPLRLSGNLSLSEKYVLAHQRGSIGFLADTHYGIPQVLDPYNTQLYTAISRTMYGNTIGNQMVRTIQNLGGADPGLNYYTRIHVEELTLHGDPALKINTFEKPDYAIEDQDVRISPNIITVADASFSVNIKMHNLGRATNDSIWVSVKRKLPNDSIRVLSHELIRGIRNLDSIVLPAVTIIPTSDKGLNQIIVTLDETNRVDELYETNNTVTKEFYIFEDELRPTFPYDYSIINQQNITYVANTADPLSAGQRQYVMEIDTTELFNSPFKKSYNQTGGGGIVEFTPTNITFTDSTVYYWRVAMVPSGSAAYIWNGFSFIYLPNSSTGFNQSHYYQHLKSTYSNITLDADRKFRFKELPRNLIIRTGLYPYFAAFDINVNLDVEQLELYGCRYRSIQVYVFDTTTLRPWRNYNVTTPQGLSGRFGSYPVCQNSATPNDPSRAFFEFPYYDAPHRKAAIDFITDSIPDGMYVAITNLGLTTNTFFIRHWKDDTLALGSGHSLYHTLKNIGFTQIDSFYHNLPFLYFYQKGMPGYTPRQVMGPTDTVKIDETFTLRTISTEGSIQSVNYGPARAWTSMHWRGSSVDTDPQTDSVEVEVWGVRVNGTADSLATVNPSQDTTLNFVNATTYPYLRLKMKNADRLHITPHQLRYLRVNADLVPEGAVAPGIVYQMKDSVLQGEPIEFKLAFKNISQTAFDSLLKVNLVVKDRNNVDHPLPIPKRKALVAGDTLIISYTIDTKDLPGLNTLAIDVNPAFDQPEQYHYNNVLFKEFYVKEDLFNPLLDVTFDGIHILNRDIVSAKPHILIKLKDESRFLELKDTNSIKLQVRYPDNSLHTYYFGDTMRFTPANLANGENSASIDFNPNFITADQSEEGEDYELIVTGKDAVGNKAGDLDYHVMFKVINKPMISNLFNYPNPFTTSTAFVFTVTGSEIPQMRIQILTITGKVVKEIPRSELGNIHIGNNITDYKWDGTDMYGQKLANGVYIYRVITSLNGKKMDKYKTLFGTGSNQKNTDKLFNKGYGKMYLMR
ncbi:MAG: C25 family cysteine peptidase [Ferruginibacter sp.]